MEYSAKTREIGDRIANLTLLQGKELSEYLEEVHGLKPAAPQMVPPPKEGKPQVQDKTEFDVFITEYGDGKKIGIIKIIRQILSLGLKEAKDFVESLPAKVKEGITREDAEKLKKELEEAGATVSIK